jgi:peptidyl-prolyl cis-trans isomerase A (cyclophilin A)
MGKLFLVLLASFLPMAFAQTKAEEKAAGGPDVSKLEPGLYALINTTYGTITALLYEKQVPVTVANFVGLARGTRPWVDPKTRKVVQRPLYADITFHRVIPDFMIQTGDPTATGTHDCGFFLKDEIVPELKFDRPGRLAMANSGQPNSGACQFFITETPQPSLNGAHHTIFGQVVDGQSLVAKIARVIRDDKDKPRYPIKLMHITFLRIPAKAEQ